MLVLSRKLGQRFQVGRDIVVSIVRIEKHGVRIGIDAPDGTPILREELILGAELEASEISDALQEKNETMAVAA